MQKNEIVSTANSVITHGESFINTAKDAIACCEIFLRAVKDLKVLLEKED